MTSDERDIAQLDASIGAFEFCDTSEEMISTNSTAAGFISGMGAAITTATMGADGYKIEKESVNVSN